MQAPKSSLFTETHTMLSLGLLGPFQATLGEGAEIKFRTHKEQALLAFLAVEASRPHRREALAELLWPERPEGMARTNLRQALAGLRRAISGRHLLTTRTTVQFNAEAEHWLDLAVYEAHWRAIRRHIHDDEATCPICMGHRQQAVALYRGEFLSGLETNDSRDFQEWVTVHRESLFRQQAEALRQLTLYRRDLGDLERAGRYARRWAELDFLSEAAHRQRMVLLALSGQRHEALEQYEACRHILAEELGLEPSPETAALQKQIRDRSLPRPGVLPAAAPKHNLPAQLTPFVGREGELAKLVRSLTRPECRLLTVVGPGGVGKSRLALQAAEETCAADRFVDGVWFIPLEAVPTPDLLLLRVAQDLGLDVEAEQGAEGLLLDHLRPRTLLLVLDNLEHLLDSNGDDTCGLLLDTLREAPGIKMLVTSRERLSCQAEILLDLKGLPYPQDLTELTLSCPKDLQAMSGLNYPALQLFVERAGRARSGFAATEEMVLAIARICQLVDGLPLGIELAAASLGQRTPGQVAQSIQEGLDALAAPLRDLPRRQRSMRAAFEHSWRLLSEADRAVYRRLSLFRGGFGPEAALAVVGSALDLRGGSPTEGSHGGLPLGGLVDKSLVRMEAGTHAEVRYSLHPLLRQYAEEKLAELPDEEATTQGRHGRYYLNFLREREKAISGEDGKEALDQIQSEMGNVRLAWRWAADKGKAEALGLGVAALSRFYSLRGPLQDAEREFGHAAQRVATLDDQLAHRVACRLLTEQADFARRRGDYEQAIEVAQSAIALAQANGQAACEARAAVVWGESLWRQSAYGQARRQLEGALILAQSLPDGEPLQTRCLNGLAAVSWRHGDFDAARAYLEESLPLATVAGEARRRSVALGNLGVVAVEQGEYEAAEQYYRRALEIEREIGEREGEGVSLLSLGNLSLYLGAYAEAERRYLQALAIHQEVGARQNEAWTLGNLGLLAHYCGDEALALQEARQALKIAEEIGHKTMQAAMWMKVGHALAGLERLQEAAEAYRESVALRRALDEDNMATEPLAGLARGCLAQDDPGQAQSYVEEILSHLGSGGTLDGTISPFQVRLTCYHVLDVNQDPRAREILAEGYELLQGRAAKITDEKLRHSFLENVAAHRELVQALERMPEAG